MRDFPIPNPSIAKLHRLDDRGSNRSNYFRLDKNERTYPFENDVIKKIFSKDLSNLITMYPDQNELYKIISKKFSVDIKEILLTAGSDVGIKHVFETFLKKRDKVLFLSPTYAMIEVYSDLYAVKKYKIEYDKNNSISINNLIKKLTQIKPKCLFIANPNQPTGTFISESNIIKIAKICKKNKILFVLDHAYFQFVPKKEQYDLTNKLSKNPFIIILNTFSKAYGLAGLRLGYIITNKYNINQLFKVKSYSDINYFSIIFASYILKNNTILKSHIFEIKKSKNLIKKMSKKYTKNFRFVNSYTNFIHLHFFNKLELEKLYNYLKKRKFFLRINHQGLPATLNQSLRITIPSVEQTKKLIKEINSFYKA